MKHFVQPLIATLAVAVSACSQEAKVPAEAPQRAVAALRDVRPGGEFEVGARDISSRGIALWIYYPAGPSATTAKIPALPPIFATALARRFGGDAAAALAAPYDHVRWMAAPKGARLPLLVFSPGAGVGSRAYELLIEALASRGYVVAVLNPLQSPAPSDERYQEAANEFATAIGAVQRLANEKAWANYVDFERVGLVGHSIGGAAAVLALTSVPARAAANLDGDYGGASRTSAPRRPILYLVSDNEQEGERTLRRRADDWNTVAGENPFARIYQLQGFRHFTFSDAALLPTSFIPKHARRERLGSVPGLRGHEITVTLLSAFFDETLRGKDRELERALAHIPEATNLRAF